MKNPFRSLVCPLLLTAILTPCASADPILNGNFTGITNTTAGNTYTYGQFGSNAGPATGAVLTVDSWTTSGYNFVYTPNIADRGTTKNGANTGVTPEAPGQATVNGYGNEYMWGKNNGSTGDFSTDPFSGNFIAADGVYETGAITQSITSGLRTGQAYTLTFYWAVAQQEQYTTANPANDWKITLGSQSFTTPATDLPAEGFSGWMKYTNSFTYTGANATAQNPVTLSFLAQSSGSNPPFLLLGQVSLVPEPSSGTLLSLVGAGLTAGWCVRRRRLAAADVQG